MPVGPLWTVSRQTPDTGGIRHSGVPKTLTLMNEATLQRTSQRLPKNLTVAFPVSKIPIASDTYAQSWDAAVRHGQPPKTLTFRQRSALANPCDASRKGSPVAKTGTANRIFSPVLAGFSAISTVPGSRKASPLIKIWANPCPVNSHLRPLLAACDPYPEKAHLKPIRAGIPRFPSRKTSPFGLHRPRMCFLLCKMAVVSRKSSQQIVSESREISPFAKIAQKIGRIGGRSRSCKFSPVSAQAENCACRDGAGSAAVGPRKTSPLENRVFHCDPESTHDLSCNGSRSSPNPITSAPAEGHLGSRKTSPCRPESLAT